MTSTIQQTTAKGSESEMSESVALPQRALERLVCEVVPRQGAWRDDDYLWLTDRCRRLIEFTDGLLEEPPVPTSSHQAMLAFLYRLFHDWITPTGGVVMFAPLRMRVRAGKFRAPDLLLLRGRNDGRLQERYWLGADLVVEVVNPDNPDRDLVDKRLDYAEAQVTEYWIVDPRDESVAVLGLQGDAFVEVGRHLRGDRATSRLLGGFSIETDQLFDQP